MTDSREFASMPLDKLKAAAEAGDQEAQYDLGNRFVAKASSNGRRTDAANAVKWYRRSAEQGHANAQYRLGLAYAKGEGVEQDLVEAATWYLKSAKQGNAWAQLRIGDCRRFGSGVLVSLSRARHWFALAAAQGLEEAEARLRYLDRDGGAAEEATNPELKDPTEAMSELEAALDAEFNRALAIYNCEEVKLDGDELDGDEFPESGLDAILNAQFECMHPEVEVEPVIDPPELDSLEALKTAAEAGNAWAQFELGACYHYGSEYKGSSVAQDATEAAWWIRRAAEQGHVPALNHLGFCAAREGPSQNFTTAANWYRKAAERGNVYAQRLLGSWYEIGCGVTKDMAEAAEWHRKAAEQGDSASQHALAGYFARGDGVEQDMVQAAGWYLKAAEAGHPDAQYETGVCYAEGYGIQQDDTEAAKWFLKASRKGNAAAQFRLSECLKVGRGLPVDLEEAEKWLKSAADQGQPEAISALNLLRADGNPQSLHPSPPPLLLGQQAMTEAELDELRWQAALKSMPRGDRYFCKHLSGEGRKWFIEREESRRREEAERRAQNWETFKKVLLWIVIILGILAGPCVRRP
jgi:hypothetical protein